MKTRRFQVLLGWDADTRLFVALVPELGWAEAWANSRAAAVDAARTVIAERLKVAGMLGVEPKYERGPLSELAALTNEVLLVEIALPQQLEG